MRRLQWYRRVSRLRGMLGVSGTRGHRFRELRFFYHRHRRGGACVGVPIRCRLGRRHGPRGQRRQ